MLLCVKRDTVWEGVVSLLSWNVLDGFRCCFGRVSLAVSRSPGVHKQLYHSMNSASELMNGTDRSSTVAQQGSTESTAQDAPDKNTAGGPAVETNPQVAVSNVSHRRCSCSTAMSQGVSRASRHRWRVCLARLGAVGIILQFMLRTTCFRAEHLVWLQCGCPYSMHQLNAGVSKSCSNPHCLDPKHPGLCPLTGCSTTNNVHSQ